MQQNQRILVVDDEKNIRLTLGQTLEMVGYQVQTAVNGEDALKQLAVGAFDLILLDLRMPGMDGMQVLQQIVEERPELRVIVVTAHGTVETAVEAMKIGAVDFIQKPFAPQEIRSLVAQVLDQSQRRRPLRWLSGSGPPQHRSTLLQRRQRAGAQGHRRRFGAARSVQCPGGDSRH